MSQDKDALTARIATLPDATAKRLLAVLDALERPAESTRHAYRGRPFKWNNHRYYLISRFRRHPTVENAMAYARWVSDGTVSEPEELIMAKMMRQFGTKIKTDVAPTDHPSPADLPAAPGPSGTA